MTTDVTAKHDLSALTTSLKKRLEECSSSSLKRDGKPLPSLPHELHQDLLDALDLLVSQAQATGNEHTEPSYGGSAIATGEDLSNRLASTIDESMAAWQAQITSSFHQATARELNQQLELAAKLTSDLTRQTSHLDEQRQNLAAELSQALQWKARVARQRKSLAQHFLEQRQELSATLASQQASAQAEFEQQREQQQQRFAALQDELALAQQHSATLAAQLESQTQTNTQLDCLQTELNELRCQLQVAEEQRQSAEEAQQATLAALEELRERPPAADNAEQLTQANRELESVEQQLYDLQLELLDLRSQNSDLASQIAKHQLNATAARPHECLNQESLTWEERKQLIMQQLDADADAEQVPETTVLKNLEIEDIINTTQKEIERRDREIGELHSIIEQQSSAREGMAIGAAAIAQMLDADELISQERQKLKDIQREWEDKLRQAEIDLSMERAKLARERTQLETELEQARKSPPSPFVEIEGQTKAQARTRKWLEHLGLKENRKHTPDED